MMVIEQNPDMKLAFTAKVWHCSISVLVKNTIVFTHISPLNT